MVVNEEALRPERLEDYIGQSHMKDNLRVDIQAAVTRDEALKHLLFHGPPGLGKTTVARIAAHEMGVTCVEASAPGIADAYELRELLRGLQDFDVLFIDEVHRLPKKMEEILYPVMEDGVLHQPEKTPVPPFTLIGATTRFDLVAEPLRDRFGEIYRMRYYELDEITRIITRSARILELDIDEDGVWEIGVRARGTPRVANRLACNVRDHALVHLGGKRVSGEDVVRIMRRRGVDELGLTEDDRILLGVLLKSKPRPVSLDALAAAVSLEPAAVQNAYEPLLLREGLIERTSRGRIITSKGESHIIASH